MVSRSKNVSLHFKITHISIISTNLTFEMQHLEEIKKIARTEFIHANGSHRWDHTLRVSELAVHIARSQGANSDIVKAAAFLHDIGRTKEDQSNGKICHAKLGAQMAEKILNDLNMESKRIKQIVHCVAAHRFRDNISPETTEAKSLFDADKLDSIGAVGIGRAFLFAGENGAHLHNKAVVPENVDRYSEDDTAYNEFLIKLQFIKNRMLTEEGKKIAESRHQFMVDFFERLNKEVDGLI